MPALKTGLLWLLCAVDTALGVWLAYVFGAAMLASGVGRTVTLENAGYINLTALFFVAPVMCWVLRAQASLIVRLLLAALPIAVFLGLGGRLWMRWA